MASKQDIVEAIEEAGSRASRRRQLRDGLNEMRELFIGCVGGLALLTSVFRGWFPSVITWTLVAGAVLSALLALIINTRRGVHLWRTLIELGLIGAFGYAMIAGPFWYFMTQVASKPLFTLGITPAKQPQPIVPTVPVATATSVPPEPTATALQTTIPTAEPPSPRPVLQRGDEGFAVSELQLLLNDWIAATPGIELPQLPINGAFGPRTEATVRAFQHATGLTVDGVAGPQTWEQLVTFDEYPMRGE